MRNLGDIFQLSSATKRVMDPLPLLQLQNDQDDAIVYIPVSDFQNSQVIQQASLKLLNNL